MKKNLAAFLSLIFMFSIVLLAIIFLSIFVDANFLYTLITFEILALIMAFLVGMQQKRRLDVKIRWALFLIFVPVIGVFSYIFFGRQYKYSVDDKYKYVNFKYDIIEKQKQMVAKSSEILATNPEFKRSFLIANNEQGDLPYTKSKVDLQFNASQAWINIFRDLDQAQNYILINYYIIEDGELFRNLTKLLIKKAQSGVQVYLIFDFIGSYGKFTYKEQVRLTRAGVHLTAYSKLLLPFLSWKANYRTHRKDIVIDGKIGYYGGSNISDQYVNRTAEYGFWHDEQVRLVGDAVGGLEKIFVSDWAYCTGKDLAAEVSGLGVETKVTTPFSESEQSIVQVVACGPNHSSSSHLDILLNLIASAQKRIWLSTPYFVPPNELIVELASAAKSGIDVRLVLPGMTDKFLLLDVSKKHTDLLFDSGVKIYTMNNVFNHTKAYLIDNEMSFVGSTNLDYRALFSDQQTMGLVYSREFNQQLSHRFEWDFQVSKKYSQKPSREHNFLIRGMILLVNWAAPLL